MTGIRCPECGGSAWVEISEDPETGKHQINVSYNTGATTHEPGIDPEPQPGDGPDYHAEHAAWRQRNPESDGSGS